MLRRPLAVLFVLFVAACGRGGWGGDVYPVSLRVEPAPLRLYAGQKVRLQVTALFEYFDWDRWRLRAEDISAHHKLLLWTTSDRVAEVKAGPELWALEAGQAVLRAYFQGVHVGLPVEVSHHPLYLLEVEPEQLDLELGKYRQLKVTGRLTDESEVELTSPLFGTLYESSDSLVATATVEGLVFAQSDGRAEITARLGDFQARAKVVAGSGRSLYAVDLVPARLDLDIGESARLQLVGRFTDQTVEDLTRHPHTRWEAGDAQLVRVEPGGLVTALSAGETVVRAYHRRWESSTTVVVRRPDELVDLVVSPAWLRLSVGDRVQLSVQAVYWGGDLHQVTAKSQFASLDPDVASVAQGGLVTANGRGATPVRISFGARTAVCQVAVQQPAEWLEVKPAAARLQPGEQLFLQVLRHSDTGQKIDVTDEAGFLSLSPQVAEVDATGRLEAKAPGLASVLAAWRGLEAVCQITVSGQ